jgi:ABC-type iron transport system FetAB ATPase subunit
MSTTDNRMEIDNLRFAGSGPFRFTVSAGECVGLSGPSGAGKTRLLRAISDLDPHEGDVFLGGLESREVLAPIWRRQVALLLAESVWWRDLVGAHFTSVDEAHLTLLGFDRKVMAYPVSHLSTGERQRLALLRMLENRPRALLLDEPTASLDADNTRRVEALLMAYRRREAVPVLWVSHDPSQLARVADRQFILENGRLVQAVPPQPA